MNLVIYKRVYSEIYILQQREQTLKKENVINKYLTEHGEKYKYKVPAFGKKKKNTKQDYIKVNQTHTHSALTLTQILVFYFLNF